MGLDVKDEVFTDRLTAACPVILGRADNDENFDNNDDNEEDIEDEDEDKGLENQDEDKVLLTDQRQLVLSYWVGPAGNRPPAK